MDKNTILTYTALTPENLNPGVLSIMLDNLIAENPSSEGGSTKDSPAIYYYPNMTIDEFEESEYAQNIVPFSLIVVQNDKDNSVQELYYYYVYENYARTYWYLTDGTWELNEAGFIGDISD